MIDTKTLTGYTAGGKRALGVRNGTLQWGSYVDDVSAYGSLAAAVAAIGNSTEWLLTISEPITLAANVDLSATKITIQFLNDGRISVNSGVTLTVGSMISPGNKQVFTGAGTIRFAHGSVPFINLAWRAGNANSADVTTALTEALASVAFAPSIGGIYVPQFAPETSGGHVIGHTAHIFGNANFHSGLVGAGTTLKLKAGSSAAYMFKIATGQYCMRFSHIILDANGQGAAKDAILCEGTEAGGQTSADVTFERVTFSGGWRYGLNHNSLAGQFQLAQVGIYNSIFQSCAVAGIRTNSVNAGLTVVNTNFQVPANGMVFKCDGSGLTQFIGCEYAAAPFTNAKVIEINAAHGGIIFNGCQDEGFITFLENNASDMSGIVVVTNGSLIQAKFQINQAMLLIVRDSNLMSYALQGNPTGGMAMVENCHIRTYSANDGTTIVNPPQLSSIPANAAFTIVTENLPIKNRFITRLQQFFLSTIAQLGSPNSPVVGIGHETGGANENKVLLRLGRYHDNALDTYAYDFYRGHEDGALYIRGNQAGYERLNFNGYIFSKTPEPLILPCSDEDTDLTTGQKFKMRVPYAFRLIGARAQVNEAPTGADAIVNVKSNGTTIFGTKITIEVGEETSVSATNQPTLSITDLPDDSILTVELDQVGSTIAGKGLKVTLYGYRF